MQESSYLLVKVSLSSDGKWSKTLSKVKRGQESAVIFALFPPFQIFCDLQLLSNSNFFADLNLFQRGGRHMEVPRVHFSSCSKHIERGAGAGYFLDAYPVGPGTPGRGRAGREGIRMGSQGEP